MQHASCVPFYARPPITLTIAGTDPSGGAGIHADLKTFTALRTLGTSVITALVAQNTQGVQGVLPIDLAFVQAQFQSVLDDLPIDATKTGMLGSRALIEQVVAARKQYQLGYFVVDPVMVATSGHRLLPADAVEAVKHKLLPVADLITPNLPEAAWLLGESFPAASIEERLEQAHRLLELGPQAVLLKGGHAESKTLTDVLVTQCGVTHFYSHPRIHTQNNHGTGCTLSAAITALAAQSLQAGQAITPNKLIPLIQKAIDYLWQALEGAKNWQVSFNPEQAHGPVNHFVNISTAQSKTLPFMAHNENKEVHL